MTDAAPRIEATQSVAEAQAALASPRDYLQLLKPRVMSLVIFTALAGMVCARGNVGWLTGSISILCIAIGAGASGALNMAYEADLDARMKRTKRRPTVTGLVAPAEAAAFGMVLSLFAVAMLGFATNWTAAALLAGTIAFYAIVYTRWLKRWTPQNIVIGGAAGALPPVVGWAAASGHAPLNAWLLFLIIFLWTPPHFWALGLYTREDYARAGVPMMPVVKGAKSTRRQILAYSLLLAPAGVLPAFTGLGGPIYLAVSAAGGLLMVALAVRLAFSSAGEGLVDQATGLYTPGPEAKPARDVFAVSIGYLFILFATLLVEQLAFHS
ncbi:heme o synthase [soil metagenome]